MTLSAIIGEQVLGIFTAKTEIIEVEGLVDLYSSEVHELRIAKTSHPIEGGSSITDNSIVEPQRLRMEGFVSNLIATEFVSLPAPERGKEAWVQLEELARRREPVSVLTALRLYENLLVTSITATVTEATGTSLSFQISFEEILFADSEFVRLPASALSGPAVNKSGTVEGGIKQATELTPEISESLINKIVEDIRG